MALIIVQYRWSTQQQLAFKFCFSWVLLFIISVPFPHGFIPDPAVYFAPLFELPVKWFAQAVLHLQQPYTSSLISDSTGLYIHCLLLTLYAFCITIIWSLVDKNRRSYTLLWYLFTAFIRYYLALQLFTYGFSKIFKWQFYLPEPNTLFTTIGNSTKDMLYWSTMGLSRSYSIFTGCTEVLAAALLLFKRTALAGALLAFGIMVNVAAINFGFDISVKLYSLFLCCLCLLLIAPYGQPLINFLFRQRPGILQHPTITLTGWQKKAYLPVKLALLLCILLDPLWLYIKANNFNDDLAKRPLLHGAYAVNFMVINNDTLAPAGNAAYWKRVFIHRQGYFITQYSNDAMQDYQLQYDTANKYLVITDYAHGNTTHQLQYTNGSNNTVLLKGAWQKNSLQLGLQAIDLYSLPVFTHLFNWTIDTNH